MGELLNKKLVVLGDSLIYGNKSGTQYTWPSLLAEHAGMIVSNYGMNGNSVAFVEGHSEPMCRRFRDMEEPADYVVLLGGANDRRLNVPLGEIDSMDETTFMGALNILANGLLEKYPKAKLLFMTNYNRKKKPNALGLCDIDYVDAMLAVAARYAIPCFDNYRHSGLSFQNRSQRVWIDEALALGEEKANYHFSPEAYRWLLPRYEALLRGL